MKNVKLLIVVLISFISVVCSAQEQISATSTLYIVRTSSLGAAMNFKFFMDDQYLGKFNYGKYFKLEVPAGEHVIWAKAENRSYVKATLEAGQTYVINAEPKMGAMKASVALKAINEPTEKEMERIIKYINKKKLLIYDKDKREAEQKDYAGLIEKGMQHYNEKVSGAPDLEILHKATTL
ncbi:hypothetical protein KDU71_18570 [Carboxylicivirga sediminis]|uniref:DUF2846 domain-containing protein n=1 Tax=Carboxylicivirga sediminis TaxID=2006564 RepID=A0A941F943_9BACT|nr:DUF2846 domain-containing protein [Carboxylicivirga sediminis]MBR8537580.1 hypothetical protein [Carboxylicivirga sediminis]